MDSQEPTTYYKSVIGWSDTALKRGQRITTGMVLLAVAAAIYSVRPTFLAHQGWSDPVGWLLFAAFMIAAFGVLIAYGYLTEPFDHELDSRKKVSAWIASSFDLLGTIPFEKANEIRKKGVQCHRQALRETGNFDTARDRTSYQVKLMLMGFGFTKVGEVAKVWKDLPFHGTPKAPTKTETKAPEGTAWDRLLRFFGLK